MQAYQAATTIQDLRSELTYVNTSKTGRQQTRQLEQYILRTSPTENTYNLLLRFTAPGDVAGTSTLTIQHETKADDQWLYLPVLRNAKRISASNKADRFMGTEMTYEDLSTYLSEPLEDYHYELLGEGQVGERTAHKIRAIPAAGTPTQYSSRTLWLDTETQLMLRTDFYDLQGNLLKVFTASDLRQVAGSQVWRAHQIRLENRQSGNRTEVTYRNFVIDQGVEDNLFTKTYLETR